ncbi:hypothetical protein AOQ84DRAFT_389273 [Glonium stellatum]|uniref:Uncharacterized protein n=1 Tax=Glonium stellatum TaxID=574774 RepID=A0A8E2F047_9PEZI|nr:hypothetical protein AOQ84DRAFT_389273 [Glonium stellatum]
MLICGNRPGLLGGLRWCGAERKPFQEQMREDAWRARIGLDWLGLAWTLTMGLALDWVPHFCPHTLMPAYTRWTRQMKRTERIEQMMRAEEWGSLPNHTPQYSIAGYLQKYIDRHRGGQGGSVEGGAATKEEGKEGEGRGRMGKDGKQDAPYEAQQQLGHGRALP